MDLQGQILILLIFPYYFLIPCILKEILTRFLNFLINRHYYVEI